MFTSILGDQTIGSVRSLYNNAEHILQARERLKLLMDKYIPDAQAEFMKWRLTPIVSRPRRSFLETEYEAYVRENFENCREAWYECMGLAHQIMSFQGISIPDSTYSFFKRLQLKRKFNQFRRKLATYIDVKDEQLN